MLFAGKMTETKTFVDDGAEVITPPAVAPETEPREATATELFALYEKIAAKRGGRRDAQIFEALREWTFSDFSIPPYEFAGITAVELAAWQRRHRINLSAGHIRPEHIDLARGHAWGTIRRGDHVNGRHTVYGPPSREEMIEMMGSAG